MDYHILCSTDDNYAQQCAVMIYSLFSKNSESSFVVHVVGNKLSSDNRERICCIGEQFNQPIVFHHVEDRYTLNLGLRPNSPVSIAAYYRLFVSSIITDEKIDRILYLDCDTIINREISDLFILDLKDFIVAAVRDIGNPRNEDHQLRLSLSYDDRYFNSGVLLINLKKWRSLNIQNILLQNAVKIGCKYYHDQDPLNAVFRNQWLELPPCWNRFNVVKYKNVYFKNKADELEYIYNPRIIHYASPTARPWMNMRFVPWGKEYEKILVKTPWKNSKKTKVETRARYKHLLKIKYSNFLYRSPMLIRILVTSFVDCLLFVFHLVKHKSLRYYSPYRIK